VLETEFKNKARADLKTLPNTWFVKTQEVATRGVPDFLVCCAGRFVAIELKRSQEARIDPLQLYVLSEIDKAGGLAFVANPDNWQYIFETLRSLSVLSSLEH
jgi:hypothetical protein